MMVSSTMINYGLRNQLCLLTLAVSDLTNILSIFGVLLKSVYLEVPSVLSLQLLKFLDRLSLLEDLKGGKVKYH